MRRGLSTSPRLDRRRPIVRKNIRHMTGQLEPRIAFVSESIDIPRFGRTRARCSVGVTHSIIVYCKARLFLTRILNESLPILVSELAAAHSRTNDRKPPKAFTVATP